MWPLLWDTTKITAEGTGHGQVKASRRIIRVYSWAFGYSKGERGFWAPKQFCRLPRRFHHSHHALTSIGECGKEGEYSNGRTDGDGKKVIPLATVSSFPSPPCFRNKPTLLWISVRNRQQCISAGNVKCLDFCFFLYCCFVCVRVCV